MTDPLSRANVVFPMIDSHFHSIEMAEKGLQPGSILDWCFEHGLDGALDVSVATEDLHRRRGLTGRFERVWFAAGYYPSESARFASARNDGDAMLAALEHELEDERVVAVGEIGLDAHRDYGPQSTQVELFRAQLELASEHSLPVVIHNRQSDGLVIETLRSVRPKAGGVMHCFSSDYDSAKRFVDLGFLISFAGNVTYKNAPDLRDTALRLPLETVLIETDSPYLSPVPTRGHPNHPGYIGHTYEFIASIRGIGVGILAGQVRQNFRRLFRLAGESGRQ